MKFKNLDFKGMSGKKFRLKHITVLIAAIIGWLYNGCSYSPS